MGVRPRRLAAALLALALLIGCTSRPQFDPRLGQVLPDIGLVIGVGQADGREWTVGLSVETNLICQSLWLDGTRVGGAACSGLVAAATNNAVVSLTAGQADMVAGLADPTISSVEITTDHGSFMTPVVELSPIGLPGAAFGVYVPHGTKLGELRFVDRHGELVERQALPNTQVHP
ncbi:MAG: hypothetical protein ABI744_03270 [Chloroflexota bacterium]